MTNCIPIVAYLALDPEAHLVGTCCKPCGAIHLDERERCARCGAQDLVPRDLETSGSIRTFTVVHRALPDVRVPFTSVVVDLDGGGTARGTLLDPPADASDLTADTRVELATFVAGVDSKGTEAIAYGFRRATS